MWLENKANCDVSQATDLCAKLSYLSLPILILLSHILYIFQRNVCRAGFNIKFFFAFLACPIGATIPAHTRPLMNVHPCAQTLSSTLQSVISHRFCFPQFEFHHGWISIFFLATFPWYYVLLRFNFLSSSYENTGRQFYRVFMQF